ncbi:MAG: PSD1 domain-containing protein [Verrucomicrobiales bacterium]|nr:PSD1 domain-containing protein [Verrucomicrobiales bacterium]
MKGSSAVAAWLLAASVAGADEFFLEKIEPLLKQRCYECHSHAGKIKGGLVLDSKSGWERGGESGPAIVPGKPEASLLIQAISHAQKDLRMPPKKMLPAAEIALLTVWVRRGAPDPRTGSPDAAPLQTDDAWEAEYHKRLDWWSLKPMRRNDPPSIADPLWSREPVDRFIKAALDDAGLSPAPPADDSALRRRLSYVLTGLPPSFHGDDHLSYESLVGKMLASPHFGERFARHWMDVVRYTDTYGYEWDNPAKGSHEYRDYLIRAFNDDIGYDQLLREHLAGDLLPEPRIHPVTATNESLIGPMFYHLGEHRHGSSLMFNGIHQEMVNNKIDAFSKAFLATTVACARCHDHKLEAVSQRDYYALAAMFTTPRWTARVVDAPGKNDAAIAKLKELRDAIRGEMAAQWTRRGAFQAPELKQWAAANAPALKGIGAPLATPDDLPKLAEKWQRLRAAAQKANAAFAPASLDGWVFEGDGFTHGKTKDSTPLIALEGDAIIARLLPDGWHSHALSSKLPGSLRTPPQHQMTGSHLSVQVAGGEFGGHLVVDDHAFQNETVAFYTNGEPAWRSFADAVLKNGAQQVAIEFCTAPLNPNFPPRTGLAKGLDNRDFGHDKRSWLSITGIVTHDTAGSPQDELDAFTGLYDSTHSTTDPWQRIAAWFSGAVARWCDGRPAPGDREVIDWLLSTGLLPNRAEPGTQLADLVADYRDTEASIAFPRTANSMDERQTQPARYPLNVRGNVDVTGDLIPPASLRMLPGRDAADRLALAESLLAPGHPVTARVYVNRVWQWIFGTGLVATPDDFGRLGGQPSHPELLDWLATEFVREGWSTKSLVRRLVLSQTFRQSGQVSPAAREKDPSNRLLHHHPTRRLEAEAIRDSLLAVSGRLDLRLYGRPVLPHRLAEDDKKRLLSGPIDGNGRRSLYLQMSIMEPPKFLVGFNLPDLKLPTGRRDVTNVPAQALILMNDPFVNAMAEHWGAEVAAGTGSDEEKLREMILRAFGREATEAEMERWLDREEPSSRAASKRDWAAVAHGLFNAKEFIYFR